MPSEPCRHCGEETAAGARRFSGRVRVVDPDGELPTGFVCPVCLAEHPLRDERGVVLTKERLAALSYIAYHNRSQR